MGLLGLGLLGFGLPFQVLLRRVLAYWAAATG